MIDLSTRYLGLALKCPLVMSAGPLSEHLDMIRRAEDAGAAAVVLHSLFEEQMTIESHDLDDYLSRHGKPEVSPTSRTWAATSWGRTTTSSTSAARRPRSASP
jgi:hypothetical protein